MKTRVFCFTGCLSLALVFGTSVHAATYLESGGKVVIEAESAGQASGWSKENKVNGAKGGAYLVWHGSNNFHSNSAGQGTLRYTFRVKEAGNYELRWRSYITEGNNATEANDSWVRFPTGRNISGQHALNGWTKSYMNQLNQWSWSAKTVDNVGKSIRQYFSAGDHVIEISGRSSGHAIDRLVMFRYENIKFSPSVFDGYAVSSTVSGVEPVSLATPEPSPSPSLSPSPSPQSSVPQPSAPQPPAAEQPAPVQPVSTPNGNCEASGSNLNAAIQAYAASCPGIQRKDCDLLGNGWTCSSGVIGTKAPGGVSNASLNSSPSPQQPSSVPTARCEASGSNLNAAIQAYAGSCQGIPRRDCDPSDNGWTCSSGIIGSMAPGGATATTDATPTTAELSTPKPSTPTPSGNCEASGPNLNEAFQAFVASCPGIPRKDCDPSANGWTCSSGMIGGNGTGSASPSPSPTVTEPSAAPEVGPSAQALEPEPSPELPVSEPSPQPTPNTGAGSIGKVNAGDLVALHYDNCPDRDDGHALPSGKAVVVRSGLANVIVVNGTCGDNIRNSYQPGSEAVVRAVWGNQWLDYYNNAQQSVQAATQRWAQVLSNGRDVWVAEGGPSDFTASVLQSLNSQYPSLNLKKVHVVQHAAGSGAFNEGNSARIGVVKRLSDYRAIPNGNIGGNGSANFNALSTFFVDVARQSEFASEWNAAFNYLPPTRRLDFSDTVELLYLINDTTTQNVDDFARKYLR